MRVFLNGRIILIYFAQTCEATNCRKSRHCLFLFFERSPPYVIYWYNWNPGRDLEGWIFFGTVRWTRHIMRVVQQQACITPYIYLVSFSKARYSISIYPVNPLSNLVHWTHHQPARGPGVSWLCLFGSSLWHRIFLQALYLQTDT